MNPSRPPEPKSWDIDPEALSGEVEEELERFRLALELEDGFAFHVVVADTRDLFEAVMQRLPEELVRIRPRALVERPMGRATTQILAELDRAIKEADGKPLLVDAMDAGQQPVWSFVFQRLNELRNGLEQRHGGPLVFAVTPMGETVLGHGAPDLWSKRGSGMRLRGSGEETVMSVRSGISVHSGKIPDPPSNPRVFESLCLDVLGAIWDGATIMKSGRQGQPQAGVDIFGLVDGQWIGVQCQSGSRALHVKMTSHELDRAVDRARSFNPTLGTFIVALAGPRDLALSDHAFGLSETHKDVFSVQVLAWPDLWDEIQRRPRLLDRFRKQWLGR